MANGRDANGRFVPGFASDRGRGRKPYQVEQAFDAQFRTAVREIANEHIVVRDQAGRRTCMTLFEHAVRSLATSGRRCSTFVAFIKMVRACASRDDEEQNAGPPPLTLDEERERLWEVTENGSDAEFNAAHDRFVMLLPGPHNMSNSQLLKALKLQLHRQGRW